jgi:cathepsin L
MFVLAKATSAYFVHQHEEKAFLGWMRETNQLFTGGEYQFRFGIWMTNKRVIQEHNAANKGFFLEANKFAHLTPDEYKSMLGFRMSQAPEGKTVDTTVKAGEIDWRTKGVVADIKDQGQCGSCWAFSAVTTMESLWAVKSSTLYVLSEQNIVDCVTLCNGCNGGFTTAAYGYVYSTQDGYWQLDSDYPYVAREKKCAFDKARAPPPRCKGCTIIKRASEQDLESKVTEGPVCVSVDASSYSFQLYKSGIFDDNTCSSIYLNHAIGCVGYGKLGDVEFWIVRNSWGKTWGEEGYMRIVKGYNRCGIATMACYPKIA